MIKDYHIHPQVIQKSEMFDEFAKVAIRNKIEEVCITDHMPIVGSAAGDRIPDGRIEEYCEKVRQISEKYKGILSVKLGIEIDYHPSLINEIDKVLKSGNFDFVIGSSHLHAIKQIDIFHSLKKRNEYAEAMFCNTIKAAESGRFNAIAHLDMYHWIFANPERFPLIDDEFSEKKHDALIEKTLDAIKENGMCIEINPHFASARGDVSKVYPSSTIVERALSRNISFSYGSDAHTPEDVGVMLHDLRNHPIYAKAINVWEESPWISKNN